jgi:hypothetical protein
MSGLYSQCCKEKVHTKSRNVLLFELSSEMSLDEGSLKVRLEVDLPTSAEYATTS